MFLRNKSRHVKTFNEGKDQGSALTQAYWEGKGENFFDYFTRAEVFVLIFQSAIYNKWQPEISHFKFFYSDTAVWKMAVSFKVVLRSLTNSTYFSGSFSIPTPVICALSAKKSTKKGTVMPDHNTWAFLMYDILLHLNHSGLTVLSVTQVMQTCPSIDRCLLSSPCYYCDNYTFFHLSKSLLLRMRTCWLIHLLLPSSSFSFYHVTSTRQPTPIQSLHVCCTQTW